MTSSQSDNYYLNMHFPQERALFALKDATLERCIFTQGESPLKHGKNLELKQCHFEWKYPLWYTINIDIDHSSFADTARSGFWYVDTLHMADSTMAAPKGFRRSRHVRFDHVSFQHAQETLWTCSDIVLNDCQINGEYFAKDSDHIRISNCKIAGNYAFDGASDIEITDSTILAKDCFWNCKNVKVKNSVIIGEYLAWNTENIVFENCVIRSLQGLNYTDQLVMRNCTMLDSRDVFEYSTLDADIHGHIDSILNPTSGYIDVDSVGEITLDQQYIDPEQVHINVRNTEEGLVR